MCNKYIWIAVIWGFLFGWIFFSFLMFISELNKNLNNLMLKSKIKLFWTCLDILKIFLIVIITAGFFWLPLYVLPYKSSFPNYVIIYLIAFIISLLIRFMSGRNDKRSDINKVQAK